MILATFHLSSANAFNLVTSKILSFGKGLKKRAELGVSNQRALGLESCPLSIAPPGLSYNFD